MCQVRCWRRLFGPKIPVSSFSQARNPTRVGTAASGLLEPSAAIDRCLVRALPAIYYCLKLINLIPIPT